MKKISVRKVILLSIVTLGIYAIIWLACRRNELVQNYNQKLPHWLWLVIPGAAAIGLAVPLFLLVLQIKDPAQAFLLIMTGTAVLSLVPFAISVWWVARYGAAVSKITAGRVPTVWTVLLYIFWGFVIAPVHQYYFNRFPTEKIPAKSDFVNPSRKFVTLSAIAITISFVLTIFSLASIPGDYQKIQQDIKQTQQDATKNEDLLHRSEALLAEYQGCIDKLESDFPGDITVEEEAVYNEAYDECEAIRVEQTEAADAYNKQ